MKLRLVMTLGLCVALLAVVCSASARVRCRTLSPESDESFGNSLYAHS